MICRSPNLMQVAMQLGAGLPKMVEQEPLERRRERGRALLGGKDKVSDNLVKNIRHDDFDFIGLLSELLDHGPFL